MHTHLRSDVASMDACPSRPQRYMHCVSNRAIRLASCLLPEVASAVAHCHAHGIAHRDIKHENVVLVDTQDAVPRRIDMGRSSLVGGFDLCRLEGSV